MSGEPNGPVAPATPDEREVGGVDGSRKLQDDAEDDRGQTVLDFVVGMSVFLLAVGFTFAFVPTLLEPFTAGEGAKMIVAERGAAHLAETSFAAGASPATLSAHCTRTFFDDESGAEPECGWTETAVDLHTELGVHDHHGLNLTITEGGEPLELKDENEPDSEGTALVAGDVPPPGASVSAGSRIVRFDTSDQTYRLTLRVW